MKIDVAAVRKTLKSFDFKTLFYEHLGWDKHQAHLDIPVDGNIVSLTAISGFHSPMEQECLRILLRSPNPVIWCLARGLYRQIPSEPVDCRPAVADGRLVMVTPFPDTVRHITAKTATSRNQLVVEIASAVVVAHAAPGSKMEALCRDILAAGKPLYTFDHPANAALMQAGAYPITPKTNWFNPAAAGWCGLGGLGGGVGCVGRGGVGGRRR